MGNVRPLPELRSSGLLWLINRVVFHPRGYALGLHVDDDGTVTGWSLQGDGREVWAFDDHNEDLLFSSAEQTLREASD